MDFGECLGRVRASAPLIHNKLKINKGKTVLYIFEVICLSPV
jgi:hypothetical protein